MPKLMRFLAVSACCLALDVVKRPGWLPAKDWGQHARADT